jgi:hypothetical protein
MPYAEQEAIARTGVGGAADEGLGGGAGGDGDGQAGGGGAGQGGEQAGDQAGSGAGGSGSDGGQAGGSSVVGDDADDEAVATVQGCNDADKVARQLCEAATQEADPFLRAALWDEYNEYKKILARQ